MIKLLKDKAFLKRFFSIAFPVMLQQMITFIVSFVDNLMVSGLTNEAVSAVYSVNQLTFFMFVVSSGVVAGAGIFIQQFYGSKDHKHLIQSHRFKIISSTIYLVIILPVVIFFGHYVIEFYSRNNDNPAEILRLALEYMPFILVSFVPYVYTASYSTSLRETGRTIEPMLASLVAVFVNVVFNYLLIYVFELGVLGAAIATALARFFELGAIIIMCEKTKFLHFKDVFTNFRVEGYLVKTISKKSIPLLGNEILWAGGMVLISLAYAQRENVLSALSIVSTMGNIFMVIFLGLSVGISVMVGNALGGNRIDEAKENIKKLYFLGVAISLTFGAVMAAASPFIPLLFVNVSASQKVLATQLILVYASFLWAFSLSTCCYMTLRAGGKSLLTFSLDSGTMWLLVVPLVWILATYTSIPLVGIYIAVQATDVLKSGIGLLLIKRGSWIRNLTLDFQH